MSTSWRSLELEDIEAGGHGHHSDIENWAGSLTKILEDVPQYMCSPGHPGKLSRIPESLREIDVKAYEPYFLAIGPYHHGKPVLKPMETAKSMVLKSFLQVKPELTLKDYLNELKGIEMTARSFYSDVDMDSEEFVLLLLLDSIFILSLFCGIPENWEEMNLKNTIKGKEERKYEIEIINEDKSTRDDKETKQMNLGADEMEGTSTRRVDAPRIYSPIYIHDLFLVENQLPFFVLQKIYALAYNGSKAQLTCILKYTFASMFVEYSKADTELAVSSTEEVHHLLHLCHMLFRPTIPQEPTTTCKLPEYGEMFRLGSATQLYEGGISFLARSASTKHSLLDITFNSSGKIVMPCLSVDDYTNSLLRNLIALEQMKYPSLGLHISAYAVLLLHLVTTPEDAQLLRRKGIVQHHLASDKEMMYLVNKLSVGLSFDYAEDNYSLKPVFQELKRYTERRVPGWRAWLKHKYFNNPWTTISLVAASILLLLMVVQTYYTVYSYYRPPR